MIRFISIGVVLMGLVACDVNRKASDLSKIDKPAGVIAVGDTLWMGENLQVTHDQHGSAMAVYYPNNDINNVTQYGLLYAHDAAILACPNDWQLPSIEDWQNLLNYFSEFEAKDFIKHHRNATGFSATFAGYANTEHDNLFDHRAIYWTASNDGEDFIWAYSITDDSITPASQHPHYAFSVRCIKKP